jgi:hypothetical protein
MTWSREALVGYLFGMHAEKAEVGGRVVAVSNPSSRLLGESAFPACLFRNSDCNAEALAGQQPERAAQYARLKLAGLDIPCGWLLGLRGSAWDGFPSLILERSLPSSTSLLIGS